MNLFLRIWEKEVSLSKKTFLLSDIAKKINGKLIGEDRDIFEISEIQNGKKGSLSFIDNPIYSKYYQSTKCSGIIVNNKFRVNPNLNISILIVDNTRLALLKAIKIIYQKKKNNSKASPILSKNIEIGKNSFIANDCSIGEGTKIGHNCTVMDNCKIGNNVCISNNVVLHEDTEIGSNTVIQSGAIIGSDGFGTVLDNGNHLNFPHIGKAIIKDDVWIGSNTTIDRGTIGDTIIGRNSKLDNLIQIAHNVEIGEGCLIAAGVAIAGSTKIGNKVSIGGQVGIVGHLKIGNNVSIGAKSLVTKSFKNNYFISGNPASNHKDRVKRDIALRKLPQLIKNKNWCFRKQYLKTLR